jgi:hypothetical protein
MIQYLRRVLGIIQLENRIIAMFVEISALEAAINAQTVLVTQVIDAINKLKSAPQSLTADQIAALNAAAAAVTANNATLTAAIA